MVRVREIWMAVLLGVIPITLSVPVLAAGEPGAEPPVKLRIAYPSGMNGQIPVVMEKMGIAKKHGIDAEYVFFQYGPPMMEALASGHVDAIITSLMPVSTFLSRQPGAAVVVAGLGRSSYSLMVPKDSPAKDIKALRGKRIAVSFNSDSHLDLLRTLKAAGMDSKNDVKLLNVQPNELVLTLNEGFAEAIVIRQPQVLKVQEQFGARIIHTWPFNFVSIMRAEYLAQNPAALARYRASLRGAIHYIANNKEQASVWFGERLRVDPEIVRRVSADDPNYRPMKSPDEVVVGITPEIEKMLSDWFESSYEHGMIKTKISVDKKLFAR
ncbi:MAG TPA: NrtA/SsuA/CpmA family ABC transporter substrate-binding protein [Acidiferrobacterales bacterium]|nr:NrtA/SsuA/CpmA family ABC transporter substrate-binding protein [Acidiferrobacterales bacterium]